MEIAMKKLSSIPGGITPQALIRASNEELGEYINNVGFWRTKVKRIKAVAAIVNEKGDIPDTIEELVELPGVGIKVATLAMSIAWGKNVGIGVDTHIHRVSNRLGWVKTNTPEATEKALQEAFPQDKWSIINDNVLLFGQNICQARKPNCSECPLKTQCRYCKRKHRSEDIEDSE